MQWARVKNVLIFILAAVNIFLLCSLGTKLWQAKEGERALAAHLDALAAGYGIALAEDLELPKDTVLPILSIDRSRADEETVSHAMLGEKTERTEKEDGAVRFESEKGYIEWQADGTMQGVYRLEQAPQRKERQLVRLTQELIEDWGLAAEHEAYDADEMRVTMTGSASALPVFNRMVSLAYHEDGEVQLAGLWCFGTPYTMAREDGVACNASDALLEFASKELPCRRIDAVTIGYRLVSDSSKRLQMTPTWKIQTDSGEYLVDCAKNTILT